MLQTRLSILKTKDRFGRDNIDLFDIDQDGVLTLKQKIFHLRYFEPHHYTILAADFGSPQLYSTAGVTLIPVSITGLM